MSHRSMAIRLGRSRLTPAQPIGFGNRSTHRDGSASALEYPSFLDGHAFHIEEAVALAFYSAN